MSDETLHPSHWDELIEFEELIESSGLQRQEVIELVELGVLEHTSTGTRLAFFSRSVIQARRAARLRDDFGLNTPGMALALTYLARIEQLEHRLRELEAIQPR